MRYSASETDDTTSDTPDHTYLFEDDYDQYSHLSSYFYEPLHRKGSFDGLKNVFHNSRLSDDDLSVPSAKTTNLPHSNPYPIFGYKGIAECAKHDVEYLKIGPCPSCTYEYGQRNSKVYCGEHNVEYLRESRCHVCSYIKGHKDGRNAYGAGMTAVSSPPHIPDKTSTASLVKLPTVKSGP